MAREDALKRPDERHRRPSTATRGDPSTRAASQEVPRPEFSSRSQSHRSHRAAGPLAGVDVVEIGPGPGGLTRALLAVGARRVIAVERDERAVTALEEIAARYPGRLEIVAGDALDFDPRPLLGGAPVRVVAN